MSTPNMVIQLKGNFSRGTAAVVVQVVSHEDYKYAMQLECLEKEKREGKTERGELGTGTLSLLCEGKWVLIHFFFGRNLFRGTHIWLNAREEHNQLYCVLGKYRLLGEKIGKISLIAVQ